MKKFITLLIISCLVTTIFSGCMPNGNNQTISKNGESVIEGTTLLFADDFDGDSFDARKWKIYSHDNYKRRGCYYDSENIIIQDGTLTLRTNYREGKHGEGWYSAWLETSVNNHVEDATEQYEGFSATYRIL